nr:hypothetical protein [Methanospirillum lacunae]
MNRPIFLINGILLFFYTTLIGDILKPFIKEIRQNIFSISTSKISTFVRSLNCKDWFFLLTILPVTYVTPIFLSSPSPDFPIFLLTLTVIGNAIELVEEETEVDNFQTWISIIIASFAFAIKLSAILLLLMSALFLFFSQIKIRSTRELVEMPILPKTIFPFLRNIPRYCWFFFLIIFIPMTIRGIILSGNPIFPIAIGSQSYLPWATSAETTRVAAEDVTAWARLPGVHYKDSLGNNSWIWDWIDQFIVHQMPLIVTVSGALILVGIVLYFSVKPEMELQESKKIIISCYPLVLILAGLTFWFMSAPDTRFALGFLYALPIVILLFPYIILKRPFSSYLVKILIVILIGQFLISATLMGPYYVGLFNNNGEIPVFPEVSYTINTTNSGERIIIPENTDQTWNLPLPNSIYFDENLSITRDRITRQYIMFTTNE